MSTESNELQDFDFRNRHRGEVMRAFDLQLIVAIPADQSPGN